MFLFRKQRLRNSAMPETCSPGGGIANDTQTYTKLSEIASFAERIVSSRRIKLN